MHKLILAASLFLSSLAAAGALHRMADDVVTIPIKPTAPDEASPPVDSAFTAFAFEERSFYFYFGTPKNPNSFSANLVHAIAEKTNTVPHIRVGGTSLDDSQYNSTQSDPIKIPPGEEDKGIPSNMSFGPSYFEAFGTLKDAKYVIDIPFKKDRLENSKRFAKAAYNKVSPSRIEAFEIGNEPNNYPKITIPEYVKRWNNWSVEISEALGTNNEKVYQAVCLGSETGRNNFPGGTPEDWKVPDLFKNKPEGLSDARIKTVSMHYYQTKANENSDLQRDIMNHDAVVRGSAFVEEAIQFLKNRTTPIPLVLGEVGSALGNGSDNSPLEAVLGSALWQVDFFLYSMSIGVKRINWQSGLTFPFALWNPTYTAGNKTVPAGVHPAFYGQIFAAEFRGKSKNVRVHNYPLGRRFFSAYAAYDDDKPRRVALVNLDLWNGKGGRSNKTATLELGTGAKEVTVKRLTSPGGGVADVKNITWGGMQWSAANDGKGGQVLNDTDTLPVTGGSVDVTVKASEAVMVFVKY